MSHDLFTYSPAPAARNSDPITSHQAAQRHPFKRQKDCLAVLIVHSHHPAGLTDFELASMMRRQQTSLGKRRGELRDSGMIEQTDKRRPAPSGSPAIVWRITDAGLNEVARK
jgi:hypothetical protein